MKPLLVFQVAERNQETSHDGQCGGGWETFGVESSERREHNHHQPGHHGPDRPGVDGIMGGARSVNVRSSMGQINDIDQFRI